MGEWTHSAASKPNAGSKRKVMYIVAGTVAVAIAAGVGLQFFRAAEGQSAEEPAAGTGNSGRATVRTQGTSKPLARVGNRVIGYEEVAAECYARYGKEVLDKMINRAVIANACEERGVEITGEEVNQEIVAIAAKFNLTVDNWFQMLKAERNLTAQQYQHDIIWPMLALKKLAGEKIVVTEDDMQKAFIRDYGPRVEAKMIMLDNFRRATDVWEKAKATPEEFPRLAKEYSIEPTSRALEGDIPPIRAYAGNENLEKKAFALKAGEISGIIEVGAPPNQRFVILKCTGRTKTVVDTIEEVREPLHKQLMEEKTQEAVAKIFEELKGETQVINYLTQETSGPSRAISDSIRPASGTPANGQVRPAGATRTAGQPANRQ